MEISDKYDEQAKTLLEKPLTEVINAAFDCGEWDEDEPIDTQTYESVLDRGNAAKDALITVVAAALRDQGEKNERITAELKEWEENTYSTKDLAWMEACRLIREFRAENEQLQQVNRELWAALTLEKRHELNLAELEKKP